MSNKMDFESIDINEELGEGVDLGDESLENGETEVTQGTGKNPKNYFNKGILTKLGIGAGVLVILVGGGWFTMKALGSGGDKPVHPKTEQVDNNKELFKTSIASAVKAQKEKHNINILWRNITVEYSKSNDSKKFKEELMKLNDERTSLLETIPEKNKDEKSTELNELVRESLINTHKFMNQAYNAKDSDSAVEIYNSFNESDKRYDNDYLDKLLKVLKQNNIKYEIKDTDDGTTTVNY